MQEKYINPLFPLTSFENEFSNIYISDSSSDKPLEENVAAKELYDTYFEKK